MKNKNINPIDKSNARVIFIILLIVILLLKMAQS